MIITKKRSFRPIFFFLLFISLVLINVYSIDDIGFEFIGQDNHLHTWNQNPLGIDESNIWFNGSSGWLQFFNGENREEALQRSSWLTNSFGLGYYKLNGDFVYYSKDHLNNAENEVTTDYSTYWQQLLYKCVEVQNKEFCAGWKRGQNTYDSLMKNHFYFQADDITVNRNVSYLWEMKDINIENDNDADRIHYCYDDLVYTYDEDLNEYVHSDNFCRDIYTDNQNNLTIHNVTDLRIIDKETEQGHIYVWNDTTDMRLRYSNNNLMLESPLTEYLDEWTGTQSTKMWWIDPIVSCNSGLKTDEKLQEGWGRAIICPDTTEMMTGWIYKQRITYVDNNDTYPISGQKRSIPFKYTTGFLGFNSNDSGIPKTADIQELIYWSGLQESQDDVNLPDDWITEFYDCNETLNCIADYGGLEISGGGAGGDYNDGFYTGRSVDWSDAPYSCNSPANFPCERSIVIGNLSWDSSQENATGHIGFNYSLKNDLWYHLMWGDNSGYSAGQEWDVAIDVFGSVLDPTIRSLLNITYNLSDGGLNVNITVPENNTVYNDTFSLNISAIVGGDYYSDFCDFEINGTVTRNKSNVFNSSSGIKNYNLPAGHYTMNVSCTDIVNYKAHSGLISFDMTQPTSIKAVGFNVSDFTIDSGTYTEEVRVQFNTSQEENFTFFSAMNIQRTAGGGTNVVSVRAKVDDLEVLEERLRSVSTVNDEGATGTKPILFNVSQGDHNLTLEFKRTGSGSIDVNDFDLQLVDFKSVLEIPIGHHFRDAEFTFEGTDEVDAYNWSVNKEVKSKSYYYTKQTVNHSSPTTSTLTFYFKDLDDEHETSPRWLRWLQNDGDVGSCAGLWLEDEEYLSDNHTITSLQTRAGNTVFVNSSILDFDLRDISKNEIDGFHETNPDANVTNTLTLTAGTHLITNKTIITTNGTGYFVSASVSIKSASGIQTPTIFINESEGSCYTKKERYLSSTSDIGNIFMSTICNVKPEAGNPYTYSLGITVPSGKTVEVLDDSLNGFIVSEFDTSTIFPDEDGEVDNTLEIYFYLGLFAMALGLLFFGNRAKEFPFVFSSGVLFVFIGLHIANIGAIEFTSQFLRNGTIIILVFIGLFIMVSSAMEEINK